MNIPSFFDRPSSRPASDAPPRWQSLIPSRVRQRLMCRLTRLLSASRPEGSAGLAAGAATGATSATRTLKLEPGAAMRVADAECARLVVDAGWLWLTEPGDPDDHFIAAGQSHRIRGRGPVVIEVHGGQSVRARLLRDRR